MFRTPWSHGDAPTNGEWNFLLNSYVNIMEILRNLSIWPCSYALNKFDDKRPFRALYTSACAAHCNSQIENDIYAKIFNSIAGEEEEDLR